MYVYIERDNTYIIGLCNIPTASRPRQPLIFSVVEEKIIGAMFFAWASRLIN
jgi:hypothetical protein